MQEMSSSWVHRYFDFIRANRADFACFYCCNRELKELLGGERQVFVEYPWRSKDKVVFDEEPLFYRLFFS